MSDATPEEWRPVPTWEGYYEVTDLGFVRSLPRIVKTRGTGTRLNPGRVLSPSYSNSGGYPLVILTLGERREGRYVHDLVMRAFVGEPEPGQEVRHLDGNASSAALWDADGNRRLAYGTSGENKDDQVRHGTHYEASRTRCDNGHEFTEENTRIVCWPDGSFKQRACRACERDASAKLREKRETDERRCKEEGCDGPYFGRDWCEDHYLAWYKAQPGKREEIAARNAAWYQRRKDEGNPTWVPSADLPPEKLERRRAQARERTARYRARQREAQQRDAS